MVGKRVRGALYVHRDAVSLLSPVQAERLHQALEFAGRAAWNVVRLEPTVVALLSYADFETDPFPALRGSTRVDLTSGLVTTRDFSRMENPLILHRKELLVSPDHPPAEAWRMLTAALEARDLFREPYLIGRQDSWRRRLAAAGIRVEGHCLCPI